MLYNDTRSPKRFDLGLRQHLDLDQNPLAGSVTLQPFESIILIDNGAAALALRDTVPRMWGRDEAADFTLTVYDPEGNANETAALTSWVVAPIARVYRPLMAR